MCVHTKCMCMLHYIYIYIYCRDLMCRGAKKCRMCVRERRSPEHLPPVAPPDLSDPLEDIYCTTVCSRILYDIMVAVFMFIFVTGLNLTTIFCLNPVRPPSHLTHFTQAPLTHTQYTLHCITHSTSCLTFYTHSTLHTLTHRSPPMRYMVSHVS